MAALTHIISVGARKHVYNESRKPFPLSTFGLLLGAQTMANPIMDTWEWLLLQVTGCLILRL